MLVVPGMRLMAHVLMRGCLELLLAFCTAEPIGPSLKVLLVRTIRFDLHATHRIAWALWMAVRVMCMALVMMAGGLLHAIYVLSSSLETAVLLEWECPP